jgi:hypothetical protein
MPNLIAALRASTHRKKTTCFELHLRMYVHPLQSIAIHCNYNDYYNNCNPAYNDHNVQNGQYDNWFYQSQAQPMQTQGSSSIPVIIDHQTMRSSLQIISSQAYALESTRKINLVKISGLNYLVYVVV